MSLILPVWSMFFFLPLVNLKAEMVLYISLTLEDLCSAPSPSISTVMKQCTQMGVQRERRKKKSRNQQHSMSTWHMDQHISHWRTIGVFWWVGMNSEPLNTSLFDSRWRNVHTQTRRSVELNTGEERCQRWKNKTGESLWKLARPIAYNTSQNTLGGNFIHRSVEAYSTDFV